MACWADKAASQPAEVQPELIALWEPQGSLVREEMRAMQQALTVVAVAADTMEEEAAPVQEAAAALLTPTLFGPQALHTCVITIPAMELLSSTFHP
jgi:hypothetical protein